VARPKVTQCGWGSDPLSGRHPPPGVISEYPDDGTNRNSTYSIPLTTKPNIAKQNPSTKPTTAAANRLNFGLYMLRIHNWSQNVEVQVTFNHLFDLRSRFVTQAMVVAGVEVEVRNSSGMNIPATGFVTVGTVRVRFRYARCFAALSAYRLGLPPRRALRSASDRAPAA
jgi:hypothetical protein